MLHIDRLKPSRLLTVSPPRGDVCGAAARPDARDDLSIKWLVGAGLAAPSLSPPSPPLPHLLLSPGSCGFGGMIRALTTVCTPSWPVAPSSSPSCLARAAGPGLAPITFPARRSCTSRGVIDLDNDQAVLGLGDGESGGDSPSHQIDHNLQSKLHVYDLPAESRACRASAVEDPARADAPHLDP